MKGSNHHVDRGQAKSPKQKPVCPVYPRQWFTYVFFYARLLLSLLELRPLVVVEKSSNDSIHVFYAKVTPVVLISSEAFLCCPFGAYE